LVVIEATGRYHRRVRRATLLAAGITTSVVNPQRAREFAKAMGKLEKSDRIDAMVLAAFGRQLQPRPDQVQPENRTILTDLVSRRRSLVQVRVAEKNRAHDELPKLAAQQSSAFWAGAADARDLGAFEGQRSIRGGRRDVRVTLYMLAHNAVLYCPRFKTFFEQLIARGKPHKVAMTACMRKLVVTLNQMVKTNTHWSQQLTLVTT
jgi:transposase